MHSGQMWGVAPAASPLIHLPVLFHFASSVLRLVAVHLKNVFIKGKRLREKKQSMASYLNMDGVEISTDVGAY